MIYRVNYVGGRRRGRGVVEVGLPYQRALVSPYHSVVWRDRGGGMGKGGSSGARSASRCRLLDVGSVRKRGAYVVWMIRLVRVDASIQPDHGPIQGIAASRTECRCDPTRCTGDNNLLHMLR